MAPSPTRLINPGAFGGFKITVPDGTKYFFGGKSSNTPDAVEFSCPRRSINPYTRAVFTANTWLLKKIVDADNNEINFSYTRQYPTCNLFLGFYELNASCAQNNISTSAYAYSGGYGVQLVGSSGTYSSDYVNGEKRQGLFQWPMYISSIQSPNETMSFIMSNAVCRRYTNDQLIYIDVSNHTTNDVDNSVLGVPADLNKLQWPQLDKLIIKDNMYNSNGVNNYNPNIIRQYQFNYSSSPAQRLTLASLQLLDKENTLICQYAFNYNGGPGMDLNTTSMGVNIYADGNFSDHWGFFNSTDIAFATSSALFNRRQANQLVVTAGLLNKITYPTGGYTTLSWESNDYSRVVAVNRQAPYVNSFGYGGGCRIFEIKSFTASGTPAIQKKYYYKKNYTSGANVTTLESSGVLNGTPQYAFSLMNRTGVLGAAISNLWLLLLMVWETTAIRARVHPSVMMK